MALTNIFFCGAETGGLEELYTSTGGITVDASVKHGPGAYSYKSSGGTGLFGLNVSPSIASGDGFILGFWYRTPASFAQAIQLFRYRDTSNNNYHFSLRNETDGTVTLLDSNGVTRITSYALSTSTWYFIEIFVVSAASGDAQLFIDSSSAGTTSSQDFRALMSGSEYLEFDDLSSTDAVYFDDIYFGYGASTVVTDRLGPVDVIAYRSSLNSPSGDIGQNLDTGNWVYAQEIPFNDTNLVSFTNTPRSGSVLTDDVGGSAGTGGPATDTNVTGSIIAHKGVYRAKRGGGGGTTHSLNIGNSAQVESFTVTLTTSPANYQLVKTTGFIPSKSQYGAIGFAVAGAQDFIMYDMLYQILHELPPGTSIIHNVQPAAQIQLFR